MNQNLYPGIGLSYTQSSKDPNYRYRREKLFMNEYAQTNYLKAAWRSIKHESC